MLATSTCHPNWSGQPIPGKGIWSMRRLFSRLLHSKTRLQKLRTGLPSAPKRSGNVAVASIDISGMPKTLASHNLIDVAGKGFVGMGKENFKYETVLTDDGRHLARNIDSEYKILDNLADRLGKNYSVKVSVTIFTEKPACESCLGVVKQFESRYPRV